MFLSGRNAESRVAGPSLALLERYFDLSAIETERLTSSDVDSYYQRTSQAWRLFNDRTAIHLATREGGMRDFTMQPRTVADLIRPSDRVVVELGCGNGYNLAYLAQRFPRVRFIGIDLSAKNLRVASKRLRRFANVRLRKANYDRLKTLPRCDIVFAVETLDYSERPEHVYELVFSALHPGGRFVMFDGFRRREPRNRKEVSVLGLTEHGMAVVQFKPRVRTDALLRAEGFSVQRTDLTDAIMPEALRWRRLAALGFRYPFLVRLVRVLLSEETIRTGISGYLMAEAFSGPLAYDKVVAIKP